MRSVLATLLLAGSFLCLTGRVKEDVTIGGVEVGGMPYAAAENAIRSHFYAELPPVVIHAPSGDVVLKSELTAADDVSFLVRKAKKGEKCSVSCRREWADAEEELLALCKQNAREAKDAEMTFSAAGFCYTSEVLGVACDYERLLSDVEKALGRGGEVTLYTRTYRPPVTEVLLKSRTQELARFTTYFDGDNLPRRHNIALAASRIAGTVLAPGESFSFNERVGKRTAENGFEVASVIFEGEFVPGVGGGVCQVSTTLFGAALRAGMTVTESRAHSLSVGYVPPSEDAMVSETSDLKFTNPYKFPVYVLAEIGHNSVGFRFFGAPDGRKYTVESRVLERLPPPPPEEAEEGDALRREKEGIKSESYLVVRGKDGSLLSRTRIRKDTYAPVRGRVAKKEEAKAENEVGESAEGEPPKNFFRIGCKIG